MILTFSSSSICGFYKEVCGMIAVFPIILNSPVEGSHGGALKTHARHAIPFSFRALTHALVIELLYSRRKCLTSQEEL
ncbi:MAG: hypothetical protein H7249_19830 [Chitinophagaceae bacterium]|nr:hypothetical protein [Oligoflexus sp.]